MTEAQPDQLGLAQKRSSAACVPHRCWALPMAALAFCHAGCGQQGQQPHRHSPAQGVTAPGSLLQRRDAHPRGPASAIMAGAPSAWQPGSPRRRSRQPAASAATPASVTRAHRRSEISCAACRGFTGALAPAPRRPGPCARAEAPNIMAACLRALWLLPAAQLL